jgi:hypothetical protein
MYELKVAVFGVIEDYGPFGEAALLISVALPASVCTTVEILTAWVMVAKTKFSVLWCSVCCPARGCPRDLLKR